MGEAYQLGLAHTTLEAVAEASKRHWHTQRTYFLPGGGGATGWRERGGGKWERVEKLLVGAGAEE